MSYRQRWATQVSAAQDRAQWVNDMQTILEDDGWTVTRTVAIRGGEVAVTIEKDGRRYVCRAGTAYEAMRDALSIPMALLVDDDQ